VARTVPAQASSAAETALLVQLERKNRAAAEFWPSSIDFRQHRVARSASAPGTVPGRGARVPASDAVALPLCGDWILLQ
jgi:hypothetical protein